jgi:filamentous hemagglutinin
MSTADHAQTASFGGSRAARAYRRQQQQLIQQGRFMDAVQMDIASGKQKGVRLGFPFKFVC